MNMSASPHEYNSHTHTNLFSEDVKSDQAGIIDIDYKDFSLLSRPSKRIGKPITAPFGGRGGPHFRGKIPLKSRSAVAIETWFSVFDDLILNRIPVNYAARQPTRKKIFPPFFGAFGTKSRLGEVHSRSWNLRSPVVTLGTAGSPRFTAFSFSDRSYDGS